jgi:polo-like kinase 1
MLIGKPPFETPEVKATYKKIKAVSYSFPDHVTISEKARKLIEKILVLDPSKRPNLDDILEDPFMTTEPIPKTIPRSTLACPPAKNFTDHYKANSNGQTKPSKNDNSG